MKDEKKNKKNSRSSSRPPADRNEPSPQKEVLEKRNNPVPRSGRKNDQPGASGKAGKKNSALKEGESLGNAKVDEVRHHHKHKIFDTSGQEMNE